MCWDGEGLVLEVFETAPFNHSGIPPRGLDQAVAGAGRGPVERAAHYPMALKARKTARSPPTAIRAKTIRDGHLEPVFGGCEEARIACKSR